ncbi:hypothetical protein, partial [Nostoc cycadae]|uniref:hypothetical protein n=1 Tax=Nostoc cycadae TaxID=246795 RepID=UPI001C9E154D
MSQNDFFHGSLVQAIKHTPSKEWAEQYLDVISYLLEFTELTKNDPRLCISSTQNNEISVSVSFRYVLKSFPGKSWVGLIISDNFEHRADIFAKTTKLSHILHLIKK